MDTSGAPYKRPRGRSPRGSKWDAQTGQWVKQKRQKIASELSANERCVANTETCTTMVVYNPGAVTVEGGAMSRSAGSSEEAERNARKGVDASHPLGSLDEPVADGRCVAIALVKLGVFNSVGAAVEALDQQRDNWTRIRGDFRQDTFLGTRGSSWHRQIIQRTVIAAGFDFRLTSVCEMNKTDSYLVDGLANDRYLVGNKWVQPYELDYPEDNPRDDPHNWQHIIAIKKGKIMRTYNSIEMDWLHLDSEGKPDPETGFFRKIDRVYRICGIDRVYRMPERGAADYERPGTRWITPTRSR